MKKVTIIIISIIFAALIGAYFIYQYYSNKEIDYNEIDHPLVYIVTVQLESNVTEDNIQVIKDNLDKSNRVLSTIYRSKDEIMSELLEIELYQNIMADWPEGHNPFNPVFTSEVRAKDEEDLSQFILEIKNWTDIYDVSYNLSSSND